ncbi:ABC transporter ATP-binding protein [Shinella yambaruensis]|uniref:ABC transporter ATP-binding protein n=1 Tax=Shinella yambaruensis TaxID=415996 RepID=A0ABQ5ZSY4_9HYPH|nr:ABC transporter ATP-binding protein [Shinella yambaruensis]MCJ8024966.1 ABC transporter ATP-binding protein [Shinella yambaruensis]MCU7979419.1 ABC transporter ATP-binding protein [Shinella yambaruensis]GLR54485.1 ABC transporter ATP-binding protein [Shinella yambaruensis]
MMALALAETAADSIALDVEGVSHRYELDGKDLQVLDDVSLAIAPGEFVALLGPSGCGKSTLLRLAAGLETPTAGKVLENGRPITTPNPDRILVFQDATLFPWRTVRGNVATGLEARGLVRERKHRIDEVLTLVKLEGFSDFYPHQLSGGMAQRAALARALVNDPKLLLLDEPFGKLDSLTRLRMQNELLDLWKSAGFTALLVTHDVEEALLLADCVIVLSDRPASIVAEVRVGQPHPRRRDDPNLVALRRSLLEKLGISHDV